MYNFEKTNLTNYQTFVVVAFLFFTGSILGWFIELFYRRFFNSKQNPKGQWLNPGFLTGPWLPVYGFGVMSLFIMSSAESSISNIQANIVLMYIIRIVIMALVMTLIEYIAGIIFIKGMHVKLWDYTNEWLNIQGIVCPKYTFFWALLSGIYYFFLFPPFLHLVVWFISHPWFSFIVGTIFGLFIVDCAFSMHLGTVLRKKAKNIDKKAAINLQQLQSTLRQDKLAKFFSAHSEQYLASKIERFEEFIARSPAAISEE